MSRNFSEKFSVDFIFEKEIRPDKLFENYFRRSRDAFRETPEYEYMSAYLLALATPFLFILQRSAFGVRDSAPQTGNFNSPGNKKQDLPHFLYNSLRSGPFLGAAAIQLVESPGDTFRPLSISC
jgi:hypothetical protein